MMIMPYPSETVSWTEASLFQGPNLMLIKQQMANSRQLSNVNLNNKFQNRKPFNFQNALVNFSGLWRLSKNVTPKTRIIIIQRRMTKYKVYKFSTVKSASYPMSYIEWRSLTSLVFNDTSLSILLFSEWSEPKQFQKKKYSTYYSGTMLN